MTYKTPTANQEESQKEKELDEIFLLSNEEDPNHHQIYLNGSINESIEAYLPVLHVLTNASEDTEIEFYINCYGGSVFTACTLLTAMRKSKAKITTHAAGIVASAATYIFLQGDELIFEPYSQFLFHSTSCVFDGRLLDIKEQLDAVEKQEDVLNLIYYKNLLLAQEIQSFKNKSEIYMLGAEVEQRLKMGLEEFFKKKEEVAQQQQQQQYDQIRQQVLQQEEIKRKQQELTQGLEKELAKKNAEKGE